LGDIPNNKEMKVYKSVMSHSVLGNPAGKLVMKKWWLCNGLLSAHWKNVFSDWNSL